MKSKDIKSTTKLSDNDKLFQIVSQLNFTLDWEKNEATISSIFEEYCPGVSLAIFWTQNNSLMFFPKKAKEIFGQYFSGLKRSDITQNRELQPFEAIEKAYSMAVTLNDQLLGMLAIKVEEDQFEFTEKVIKLILPQLSLARYATSMTEEVDKRTSIDKVTGLWNRVYFNERFREECERVKRSKEVSSVAIMALDDLAAMSKMITAEEHNNLLTMLGNTTSRLTRQTDWVVNWTTHEILFYFPNTQPEAALEVFTRCMKSLVNTHPLLESVVGLCSTSETTTARMLIQLATRRLDLARKEAAKDITKQVVCFAGKASGLQFWRPTQA